MTGQLRFPQGFVWGAATAAYQIEGAVSEEGRRPSIWDVFSHQPGRVIDGGTGDVACDHYHRLAEDLDLMAELGLPSYRFSIGWSRVQPDGTGAANPAGLQFYDRLVDGLLRRGIAPLVTLYHWDLPQALQDAGGWAARDTADRFADYAGLVGKFLGDRVGTFTTLNEPWCSAFLGHGSGVHAPGHRDNALALKVAHHLNLAHGRAVSALRAATPVGTELSVTLNLAQVYPASDLPSDRWAAKHVDALSNLVFLEPMLRARYPAELLADTRHLTDWSFVQDGDLAEIAQPLDVLGINFYFPTTVAAATDELRSRVRPGAINDPAQADDAPEPYPGTDLAFSVAPPGPRTDMGWPIRPGALTELLLRVRRDYPDLPMLVTENGCAVREPEQVQTELDDVDRIRYVRDHLAAVHRAIAEGADVRGYYLWSLMDNFEWAWGYSKRFGIVHVDFETGRRTPKSSARWYSGVIRANAVEDAAG